MIDFDNKGFFKLKQNDEYAERVRSLLLDDEQVIDSYKSMRDGVVFTDKRIIAVNVQGIHRQQEGFHVPALQQHRRLFGGDVGDLRSRLGAGGVFLVTGEGQVRVHRQDFDR
jgi:hypothetical protein